MTNYEKGRTFEWDFIKVSEKNGYMGFRSAGSHSPVDVILIDAYNNPLLQRPRVILCQLKRYKKGKGPKPAKEFKDMRLNWDWIEKWWVTRKDREKTDITKVD